MHRFVAWVQASAIAFGGPGLFVIAFLDSSFLSFPQVVDLLIIWLVTAHKGRVVYYALLPTIGSVAGCFALYMVGRKGGEAFLRRRLSAENVDRSLRIFQRYGLLAVAVPSLLPPPFPFKPFVLAAGVAGVRPVDFLIAVTIGRGIRYFGEAFLAFWYGERAAQFIRDNARPVSFGLAIAVLVLGIGWIWFRRRGAMAR
ncbi:MAG: VTT domain-containing protein [Acidobacteriota bacterium]